jgi:hypothetical protein
MVTVSATIGRTQTECRQLIDSLHISPKTTEILTVFLVLCALALAGCRKNDIKTGQEQLGPGDEAVVAPPKEPAAAASAEIAIFVNEQAMSQDEVGQLARRKSLPPDRALALLVEAELVAQQARATGFPLSEGEDRMDLARRFLATVYSEETLCGNITPRQIHDFYQVTYRPDWPADVYKGEVVGVRCCASLDDDCDARPVRECMKNNRPLMDYLGQVRVAWVRDGRPPVQDLVSRFPMIEHTEYGLIIWPGVPLEDQKKKRMFDVETMRAISRLAEGEISPPLESRLGFFLFKVGQFRKAITVESPRFREEAAKQVCKRRIESTRQQYVEQLLEQAALRRPDGEQ